MVQISVNIHNAAAAVVAVAVAAEKLVILI